METNSLAIFANFFINNEERLQRLKDSFYSFKDSPDQWVINVRGKLKYDTGKFLKDELSEKLQLSYLNSQYGWLHDSKILASKIKSDYVLFWVEDHLLLKSPEVLKKCINEMSKFKADQLWYSWFNKDILDTFKVLKPIKRGEYINVRKIGQKECDQIRKNLYDNWFKDWYIVSCVSIMERNFFLKILSSKKPYLKRWSRSLPHDFEKKSRDRVVKSINHAMPNEELFASIDDDLGVSGYSLISRNLYPKRISREKLKRIEFNLRDSWKDYLKRNLNPSLFKFISLVYIFFKRLFYTFNIFRNKT